MSAREGVSYYTEYANDLGNLGSFAHFLDALERIMKLVMKRLDPGKYCTVIMSDFTVQKREVCVQAHVVSLMERVGFEFAGNTVLLQPVKPLYPFGYPYAYKINHHHQNMMTFRKPREELG
jgi:hypothetical protein